MPAAADLATSVTTLVSGAADSLRTGAQAVRLTGTVLEATSKDYEVTDDQVSGRMRGMTPS